MVVAVAVAACSHPPPAPPCSIACVEDCPDDLTCVTGTCQADGETCMPPTFTQTSAGNGFGCGLDSTARLWCWGDNTHGEILAANDHESLAVQATPDHTWDAISAGGGHVCGILAGALSCWGRNDRGQVSLAVEDDVAAPLTIAIAGGPSTWTMVAAGFNDTCAIGGGRLFCWGGGDTGQLGRASCRERVLRLV